MKLFLSLKTVVVLIALLTFSGCSKDEVKGTLNIELADLLSVDNDKRSYTIGETLWFNIDIPNIMTDVQGNELNIRELSGALTALTNIKFFKESGFSLPSHLRLSESDYIVKEGQMELFPFETLMRTRATFKDNSFKFRFGVVLAETGEYFISTPSGEGDFETFFEVVNGDEIDFNLKTTIRGGGSNNRFLFSVTE